MYSYTLQSQAAFIFPELFPALLENRLFILKESMSIIPWMSRVAAAAGQYGTAGRAVLLCSPFKDRSQALPSLTSIDCPL